LVKSQKKKKAERKKNHRDSTGINGEKVGYKNPPKHSQFKPGVSGNPNGSKGKEGKTLTTLLREILDKEINIKKHPITKESNVKLTTSEIILLQLVSKASKGNLKAINSILDRTEGRPKQALEHSGNVSNIPDVSHLGADELLRIVERTDTQSGG
jgi:DNA-directed RNA polymerase subunit L